MLAIWSLVPLPFLTPDLNIHLTTPPPKKKIYRCQISIWKKISKLYIICCYLVAQSCPTLCDSMDCGPRGSSVYGISQARVLEWVAISSSRGSSGARDQTHISCLTGGFLTTEPLHKPLSCIIAAAKSLQSCPTLCDPIDGSLPGSPVPGILQARTLEWVSISFSNAWKWKVKVKSLSCRTLCDPMDCSLPGSSAHGIFQARVLEWGAIA